MTHLSRRSPKTTRGPQSGAADLFPELPSWRSVDSGERAKFSSETTAAMGRPKPPHRSLGGCAVASLREPAELLGDQIDRVDPVAIALDAVLAKPATHMYQVALADVLVDVGLDRLREDRDFVPVRAVLPLAFVVLEGIVGADADADCLADLLDGSDPTDEGEFGDVAHCLSPSCGAAPRCDGFSVMAGKTKQSRSPRDAGGGQAKRCAPAGAVNFGAEGAGARNADRGPAHGVMR